MSDKEDELFQDSDDGGDTDELIAASKEESSKPKIAKPKKNKKMKKKRLQKKGTASRQSDIPGESSRVKSS